MTGGLGSVCGAALKPPTPTSLTRGVCQQGKLSQIWTGTYPDIYLCPTGLHLGKKVVICALAMPGVPGYGGPSANRWGLQQFTVPGMVSANPGGKRHVLCDFPNQESIGCLTSKEAGAHVQVHLPSLSTWSWLRGISWITENFSILPIPLSTSTKETVKLLCS